jgi:hypothetical protein
MNGPCLCGDPACSKCFPNSYKWAMHFEASLNCDEDFKDNEFCICKYPEKTVKVDSNNKAIMVCGTCNKSIPICASCGRERERMEKQCWEMTGDGELYDPNCAYEKIYGRKERD